MAFLSFRFSFVVRHYWYHLIDDTINTRRHHSTKVEIANNQINIKPARTTAHHTFDAHGVDSNSSTQRNILSYIEDTVQTVQKSPTTTAHRWIKKNSPDRTWQKQLCSFMCASLFFNNATWIASFIFKFYIFLFFCLIWNNSLNPVAIKFNNMMFVINIIIQMIPSRMPCWLTKVSRI